MAAKLRSPGREHGAGGPDLATVAPPAEVQRLIAALLRAAHSGGGVVGFIDEEWIRIDGPAQSIRLFPHPGGVDTQLSGANEGALLGLAYRYDVPLVASGGSATAGDREAHLRACVEADVTPGVRSMLEAWLGGGD